ncbi:MAG: hypothetical protein HQL80_06215 [Magnetococcales bacterium]|nr:hypothetical protein [Magnetococcales bacterium]
MNRRGLWGIVSLTLAFLPGLSRAAPQQLVEFSAEVTRSDANHPETPTTGMMYVGRTGIRTETSQDKQAVWMIFKPASKLVWTVFPQQRTYMERTGLALEWPPLPEDENSPCRDKKFSCKKVGVETVSGRSTLHWSIQLVGEKGKESSYAHLWVDPRLNVAIRESYADGLTVEMRRIQEGAQPASLFELPAGYQQVALPTSPASTGVNKK